MTPFEQRIILGALASDARYSAATLWTRAALARHIADAQSSILSSIELLAATERTRPFAADLQRLEKRHADGEDVARDAELLADRVEELLPGADQSRARTNATSRSGIVPTTPKGDGWTAAPTAAASTSYLDEVRREADALAKKVKLPTWAWGLIIGGCVAGGLALLLPIVMPLLTARAGRTQVVVGGAQRRLPPRKGSSWLAKKT